MENVSHTLAGFALARGGLGKTTPLATTALVGGANLPDIDLAWSSFRSALVYMATALPGGTSRQVATLPHPGDPLRWEWIIADASSVRHGVIGALPFFDLAGASGAVLARNLDAPAVEALLKTCAGEVVSEFFRFPFATIEEGPDGGRDVVVRDARYTRQGRGFAVYSARLGADGRPIINRDECP